MLCRWFENGRQQLFFYFFSELNISSMVVNSITLPTEIGIDSVR